MAKFQGKHFQTGQGMVEFALVLPILLLLLMAVFAFGHLFFVYSSVVAASREAARWGAATGTSGNGMERFNDCAAIRNAAVRIGQLAGVTTANSPDANTPGIQIQYDSGPSTTITSECNSTKGPTTINSGDRIKVTVRVSYKPIVPLVPMPTFILQATTSRTIIRDVAVASGPTPVPGAPTVMMVVKVAAANPFATDPDMVKVGDQLTITVSLYGSDQAPTGTVQLSDNEGNTYTCSPINIPTSGSGLARTVTCTMIYTKIQVVHLDVHYTPSGSHFSAVDVNDYEINVVKGDGAETKILADSGTGYPNKPYSLLAQVVPLTGTAVPTGNLIFTMQGKTGTLCNKVLDSNGLATCDITLTASDLGNHVIVMRYISSDPVKFYDSDKNVNLVIVPYPTAITVTTIQPSSPMVGQPTRFDFTVSPLVSPPSGAPTGKVTVSGGGVSCNGDLDSLGKSSCSVNFPSAGTFDITVSYPGDGTFASSTYTFSLVVSNNTAICPAANSFAFSASSNVPNSLQFMIGNTNGAGNLTISEVDVTWNNSPVAKLQQIRFGNNVNTTTCDASGNCLWSYGSSGGLDSAYPDPVVVNSGLNSNFTGLTAGSTKTMLLAFNAALPRGSYTILVKFNGGCQVSISQTY